MNSKEHKIQSTIINTENNRKSNETNNTDGQHNLLAWKKKENR